MTIEVIKAHPRRGTRGVRTHIRHNPWDETSWEDAERREDERLSAVEAIEHQRHAEAVVENDVPYNPVANAIREERLQHEERREAETRHRLAIEGIKLA